MAPVEEMSMIDFDRSNKGASKQRRDQINAEIATMRDLLPLPESSRQRLSQLQIMSLTCVYVRKCNILHKLFRSKSQEKLPDSTDFFQALSGFVLVTTRDGKLLYISENVTDYLGHSMVDMKTQGDSLYDIVDKRDHNTVQAQLLHGAPHHIRHSQHSASVLGLDNVDSTQDVSFFCRMNMSRTLKRQSGFGDVKVMHVRGHFINIRPIEGESVAESNCVFMATCSPLITPDLKETLLQSNTMVFKTVHKLDMSFIEMTKNAEHHLGCSSEDLAGKSWYTVLHPEDIHQAKDKHMQLIHSNHEMGCMVTVRMLRADGTSFWVNSVLQVRQSSLPQNDDAYIVCINQIIDENEAYQIKLQAHMFSVYPSRAHELWGSHLSAMTTSNNTHDHIQAGHAAPAHHWIQQDGATAVPMPGYPGNIGTSSNNMPNYPMQAIGGSHRMMPYHQSIGPQAALMVGQHRQNSAHQINHSQPLVQSDQLKAMLKRKIKGPQQQQQHPDCKPLKFPRLDTLDDAGIWREKKSGVVNPGAPYHTQYHHTRQHHLSASFQGIPQNGQNVQVMQVMQPNIYSLGPRTPVGVNFKRVMPSQDNIDSSQTMIKSEQVVPDVNVPESFLTPDPSPISSPQPSLSSDVKVGDYTMHKEKGSFDILQALEKLAAMPHQMKDQISTSKETKVVPHPVVASSSHGQVTLRKTELPIFDAFDIDNFFDALDLPDGKSKESLKMKQVQIKKEILTEAPMKLSGDIDTTNDQNFIKCEALSPPGSVPNMSPVHKASAQALSECSYQQQKQISPKSEFPLVSTCIKASTHFSYVEPSFTAVPDKNMSTYEKMENASQMSPLHSSSFSPSSRCTKQESLDDLLSYFSDEGTDMSPLLTTDLRDVSYESSASSDDLLEEDHFQNHQPESSVNSISSLMLSESSHTKAFEFDSKLNHQPKHCLEELSPPCLEESLMSMQQQRKQKAQAAYHLPGELSPTSSSSSLAGEEEMLDEREAFTFDLALKVLSVPGQDERGLLSNKNEDLNLPDELDFILESLVPSEKTLEMIKHGQ